jgi:cytidylate kinase
VRAALLEYQRDFARQAPGAVLDGRDIGTVVCPDAQIKIFVTASAEERARRRHLEHQGRGEAATYEDLLADIRARDERDSARAIAPLKSAPDAVTIDTTTLDAEAVFAAAMEIIRARMAG